MSSWVPLFNKLSMPLVLIENWSLFFYFFFDVHQFFLGLVTIVLRRKFSDLCWDTDKNKKNTFLSKAQFAPDIGLGFQILVLLRKIYISCNNQCQFSSFCFHSLKFSKHSLCSLHWNKIGDIIRLLIPSDYLMLCSFGSTSDTCLAC